MITPKVWGFEDEVVNLKEDGLDYCGKRMLVKQQYRSSIHQHKVKDEVLMVGNEDGLLYFEAGADPDDMTGMYMQYPDRIRIRPNQWHRFTALRDTYIMEFSTHHEDSDSYRHVVSGKASDDEFKDCLKQFFKEQNSDRILTAETAGVIAQSLHKDGRVVGMCNGCFDLMHLGHAVFLDEAKARCEVLFVAVNTDDSVRARKGERRPFVDQKGRIGMVASNRNVDYVVVFDTKDCIEVAKMVRPDVYITTTECIKTSPEAKQVVAQGGTVEVVGMISGYNTTSIARSIAEP